MLAHTKTFMNEWNREPLYKGDMQVTKQFSFAYDASTPSLRRGTAWAPGGERVERENNTDFPAS